MKKDISFLPVEGVNIAITRDTNELNQYTWTVYLLNKNEFPITDVTIRSKGYGTLDGEHQETSTLKHHFTSIAGQFFQIIEPIDPSVFHLNNEYWVSYFINRQVYDKKFIFVPESIIEKHLIFIPELDKYGILHV
ncbi:MAG TPA: hypothetical protein VF691_02660 [Cytophagaceae bacterium]|jgi:hypothetical protein